MERIWRCVLPAVRLHSRCLNYGANSHSPLVNVRPRTLSLLDIRRQQSNIEAAVQTTIPVGVQLKQAQSVADVLNIASTVSDPQSSAEALVSLGKLIKTNKDVMSQNQTKKADFLVKKLQNLPNVQELRSDTLVLTLNSLFTLGLDMHGTVKPFEVECRRRLRNMPVGVLVQIVANSEKLGKYQITEDLVKETYRLLELRWKEISNPFTLKLLLKTSLHYSPTFAEKLEDKTLLLLETLSLRDIVSVLQSFKAANRRSLIILRAISSQVAEQRSFWEVNLVLDIIGCMGRLRYTNPQLLTEFAAFLQASIYDCAPSMVANIAMNFALQPHYDADLFSEILGYAEEKAEEFTPNDLRKIFLAIGQLSLAPSDKLLSQVKEKFDQFSFQSQIDIALDLACVKSLSLDVLEKVLSSDQTQDILEDESKPSYSKKKVRQLNAAAKYEYSNYDGSLIPQEKLVINQSENEGGISNFQQSIINSLSEIIGDKKLLMPKVELSLGYTVDAVLLVDNAGNLLSHDEYVIGEEKQSGDSRTVLPSDASKVAVVSLRPNFFVGQTGMPLGWVQFMFRIFHAAGWKILRIPYNEWGDVSSPEMKKAYLKAKLLNEVGVTSVTK